ncbi:MAG: DUF1016 family protein [Bacteroidales bacterium]|nr:DUF1016 family protein [Bacteroidales bacterium]
MKNSETKVVKIHDVKIDQEYMLWLGEIKARYRNAQIKAAVRVNAEQLLFNWQLGRDLVMRKAEEKWGSGIVEQVSLDLQAAFPESKGFSTSNLWRMKQWYVFYSRDYEKLAQLGREIQATDNQTITKIAQLGREIHDSSASDANSVPFPDYFALVPWKHHVTIVTKSKSIEEALFYIAKTISGNWSRSTLENCIQSDLYHTSGGAITNYAERLPSPQSELAQAITKDTYDFGFLSLDEGYKEEDLETELERQLTRFLLELGRGFAYLGRQVPIVVEGETRKIDMLFFHISLNCYIVIELKTVPFKPEFAGKLNYYVNLVDDLIKSPAHNPTIGLLICSNKKKTDVRYAFKGIETPIGVASYTNVQIKEIQEQLPTIEELQNRIQLLEEELSKKIRGTEHQKHVSARDSHRIGSDD